MMQYDLCLLWTIQLAPLASLFTIQLLPRAWRRPAPAISIAFSVLAAACALRLFWLHMDGSGLPQQYVYRWLHVADAPLWPFAEVRNYDLFVGFLADRLNLLMIAVVTTITVFVQVFSFYYMAEDEARPRYFGFLSFFAFSMTGLVLSNNLLQTFLFWELVGLTSYLLIGFWYQKKSAGDAARKAFVINRLADLGFYLGILLLFMMTGSVNFTDLNANALQQAFPASTLTILGILVFLGVMGKSAQFPFHVWLPDAMEGPTPVSALIHSATMVAAGVFLLARAFDLFSASAATLSFILIIGSLTAFSGAILATIQRDIKRILAYSTMSQLGLMVMAIGAGSTVAGMYHLTTHAYFKSLLFLTAGAFIHRFHSNDIWDIAKAGGKKELLPLATLFIGLLSLSGIFPFSGFFSKDMILEALHHHSPVFYGVGLLVSFITAYYSFRLIFILTLAKVHHGHHDAHHESTLLKFCRALPLVSLAAISLWAGFQGSSFMEYGLLHWLGGHAEHLNREILVTTIVLVLVAAAIAFFQFRDPQAAENRLATAKGPVHTLLSRKLFMDDLYGFLVKGVGLRVAAVLDWFDRKFVNGVMVNGTSYRILDLGRLASRLQTGFLQDYLTLALAVGVIVMFWLFHSGAGA
jgi:NADH-quinone oxidoreductase subunit L